jgi:nitrite reductase/ring-hydroxylating ferredoxin subunit
MNPVSYVPVNYTLNITQEYPHFVVDNGYNVMTITKTRFDREYIGYAGLVVWIGMDGQYHAADLCCPHCLLKHKPVEVDGFYAICPECEEHYDLSYGYANPTKGMTKFGLKMYRTILNNSMTGYSLRIVN